MKFTEMIQKTLSESGEISFGRAASAVCLVFILCWDTAYVAFSMHKLDFAHMTIGDVLPSATCLAAQAAFCATFYGINKFKSTVDNAVTK